MNGNARFFAPRDLDYLMEKKPFDVKCMGCQLPSEYLCAREGTALAALGLSSDMASKLFNILKNPL